ncbi:hypothetical protein [Cupriavidus sp. UYPR2.512]|uniref:hypothetical protein n=1 Tax=Cupriavidus sp. UYPR2.512 TaxID=1080187 RepID=UPI0003802108|nr:hypothetical protein [Cupriavidus sp. UYPR2.512]UIF85725.1 hypothetical protein KAF44_16880 [Cupriavidus necator]
MQFKTVRHRDQDGNYHNGSTVQCLRRVREVTPDYPEGKNVQRVVAKFDRSVRELPADVAAVLTPAEREEWNDWRAKQDEEHLKSVSQYELDTLADRLKLIRAGIAKGYACTTSENAVAIRTGARAVLRELADLMPEPVRGRPVIEDEAEIPLLPNFATPGTAEFDAYQRLLEEHERRKAKDQGG